MMEVSQEGAEVMFPAYENVLYRVDLYMFDKPNGIIHSAFKY